MNRQSAHYAALLHVATRSEWRVWLESHFQTEREVWLVSPKIASGKVRIPYNDTVEEALCFGWIDSTNKSLDEHYSMQRFTPRRPGSNYSQANIERLRWMDAQGLIHPSLVKTVHDLLSREYRFPPGILEAILQDKQAWKNYQSFPPCYRRIRIAYIDGARNRPGEYVKRLNHFIAQTRENKLLPGYGGIDKYYFME